MFHNFILKQQTSCYVHITTEMQYILREILYLPKYVQQSEETRKFKTEYFYENESEVKILHWPT